MSIETETYSVCEDCVEFIEFGTVADNATPGVCETAIEHELGDRRGHFINGIENDPEGGYHEFRSSPCELCGNVLAGPRHGATLIIQVEPATVTRRVMWEIDVEFPADADDRHIAESVAKAYFQDRIANGEPDTACVFKVLTQDKFEDRPVGGNDVVVVADEQRFTGREVDLSK